MRIAIVAEEIRNGQQYFRVESETRQTIGTQIMQLLVPANPYQPDTVVEGVIKTGRYPAKKIENDVLVAIQAMRPFHTYVEDCKRMTFLTVETITVPGGTFAAFHYRGTNPEQDLWTSNNVLHGVIKFTMPDIVMVLRGHGLRARPSITETPIDAIPK